MNLQERSSLKELLDDDDVPFDDIRQNMFELNKVNTLLGGHAITILGLKKLLDKRKKVNICEIGCGGADNLIALQNWCSNNGIDATFTGVDIKAACIEVAQKQMKTNVNWIISDYRSVTFVQQPDIIFSSLFCHHFSNSELVTQVQWMKQQAKVGFFINDLHRHALAYWSIKLLTQTFSSSYLVKHDAPLSVARSFRKHDWRYIFKEAQIESYEISWQWAFRYLITCYA